MLAFAPTLLIRANPNIEHQGCTLGARTLGFSGYTDPGSSFHTVCPTTGHIKYTKGKFTILLNVLQIHTYFVTLNDS